MFLPPVPCFFLPFFLHFRSAPFLPVYIYAAFSANEYTADFGQTLLLLSLPLSLVARLLLILNLCTENGQ